METVFQAPCPKEKGRKCRLFWPIPARTSPLCRAIHEAFGPKRFRSCVSLGSLRQCGAPGRIWQAFAGTKTGPFYWRYRFRRRGASPIQRGELEKNGRLENRRGWKFSIRCSMCSYEHITSCPSRLKQPKNFSMSWKSFRAGRSGVRGVCSHDDFSELLRHLVVEGFVIAFNQGV